MKRRILAITALILLAGLGGLLWYFRPKPELTITSWEGVYGRAQQTAQMAPYEASHRVNLRIAEWQGDLSDLKGDVVDFELPKAVEACRRGMLEKIDAASLPPGDDGAPADKDFVPGAIGPCWVGSMIYSQVIASKHFDGAQPSSLADFFDVVKFPGKRAIRSTGAKYTLELALLADGALPKDVYPTLSGADGIQRALAKLASLKDNLVFYDSDDQAVEWLGNGAAAFAISFNQPVFDANQKGGNLNVIWDHQLYEFEAFGVPAGDAKKDLAMDFIRFATGSKALAGVAGWVPYGPARRSSLGLVGNNPDTQVSMRDFLPTSHWDSAFAVDDQWWLDHGDAIDATWRNWVAAH